MLFEFEKSIALFYSVYIPCFASKTNRWLRGVRVFFQPNDVIVAIDGQPGGEEAFILIELN